MGRNHAAYSIWKSTASDTIVEHQIGDRRLHRSHGGTARYRDIHGQFERRRPKFQLREQHRYHANYRR